MLTNQNTPSAPSLLPLLLITSCPGELLHKGAEVCQADWASIASNIFIVHFRQWCKVLIQLWQRFTDNFDQSELLHITFFTTCIVQGCRIPQLTSQQCKMSWLLPPWLNHRMETPHPPIAPYKTWWQTHIQLLCPNWDHLPWSSQDGTNLRLANQNTAFVSLTYNNTLTWVLQES